MNNNYKKIMFIVLGALSFFFLSAFKTSNPRYISRYDLAVMIEDLISENTMGGKVNNIESFKDLSDEKYCQILRTTALKIMSGFPDKTFRPDERLRNIETVSYLQKVARLFFEHKPKSEASKQLMRLFAYQVEFGGMGALPMGVFPKKLTDGGEFSERRTVEIIFNALKKDSREKSVLIEGSVMDSFTNQPILCAFVVNGNKTVKTQGKGKFSLKSNPGEKNINLFVAAEGYESLEIKKDTTFDRYIDLKLKPIIIN